MKVNNVELDEDDSHANLVDGVKWRSTESDNSIFSRKNIGFTIGLFVLTALVISGLVLLKFAYVPCSLTRDANVENVFEHLVRLTDPMLRLRSHFLETVERDWKDSQEPRCQHVWLRSLSAVRAQIACTH